MHINDHSKKTTNIRMQAPYRRKTVVGFYMVSFVKPYAQLQDKL